MEKIRLENVSYSYKDLNKDYAAIRNIDLSVREGEFVSIVGQSGCGKTTLIRLISGLAMPTSGSIYIDGDIVTGPCSSAAVVFQEYTLFPWMTARKNIEFGISQIRKDMSRNEIRDAADRYLDKVGMKDAADKYPGQMSGGMKQRVAIARALAMDPEILLLDEPFGALDIRLRAELQQLLEDLWREEGRCRKTVLFVTHDIHEAVLLADRVLYMSPGVISADIPVPISRPRMSLCDCENDRLCAIRRELKDLF